MESKKNNLYDVTIIGAGPAGMTAAIYAARAEKTVAIIDKDGFGGQIAKSPKVENYPGFASISGLDLVTNIYEQMSGLEKVEHIINEVVLIKYLRGIFICYLPDNSTVCSRALIIATGCKQRELKLDTKDIYYCVACDGPFFKGKNVMVVGSGNTGAVYALELAQYCKNVYICDITHNMMAEASLINQIKETKNIKFLPNCTIASVKNNAECHLESVKLDTMSVIKVDAIFSAIGMIPQTDFVPETFVDKDEKGYIISVTGDTLKIPGLFVAGDCRTNQVKQVTTATSDGTIAALKAIKFINSHK